MATPHLLLGPAHLWRPAAAAAWATPAALLLLLLLHLSILFLRRRRQLLVPVEPTSAASTTSTTGMEKVITEEDLRQLMVSLCGGVEAREREGWQHVITKRNDGVSYRAWCDNTRDGPPKYFSVTTFERCSAELLRDFYMDNEYRTEWDKTVTKHEQLQFDDNSGIEIGRTIKKFPLLTPREYVLAWRIWEANDKSFYCFIKDCEHPLAPRQRQFVRVRYLRSGWCIRKIPGRDACQITVLHHEDNGMNIGMAKLAFSKGIWSYVCKMNNALRQYSLHQGSSLSIRTMRRLIKKLPQSMEVDMDISQQLADSTGVNVHSRSSSRNSPEKLPVKKSSREMIASGLLLLGSIVCLSRGRSNLGAQLAMAFFLKKAFKQEKEPGVARGMNTNVARNSGHNK